MACLLVSSWFCKCKHASRMPVACMSWSGAAVPGNLQPLPLQAAAWLDAALKRATASKHCTQSSLQNLSAASSGAGAAGFLLLVDGACKAFHTRLLGLQQPHVAGNQAYGWYCAGRVHLLRHDQPERADEAAVRPPDQRHVWCALRTPCFTSTNICSVYAAACLLGCIAYHVQV